MSNLFPIQEYLIEFEEFRKSNEFKFYIFLKENRTVFSIFKGNYRDLIKECNYHNNPRFDDIHWHETSKLRWRLQKQVIRVLSNYLSSIYWTVDFCRNNSLKYLQPDEKLLKQFEERLKQDFSENITHRFFQDLRNYISHRTFIKITTIKKHTAVSTERNIFISKSQLLESSFEWKSKSKEFITQQEEQIYIIDLLTQHYITFSEFQNSIYLGIIMANVGLTDSLISKLNNFYERAKLLNSAYILPFDHVYVQYLKYLQKNASKIFAV